MPPIRVVTRMHESDQWAEVDVKMPFDDVNDVLGVQLYRKTVTGTGYEDR